MCIDSRVYIQFEEGEGRIFILGSVHFGFG